MKTTVSNLQAGNDIHITIIELIRCQKIELFSEIANLKAGRNIHIGIDYFFQRSPDYLRLNQRLLKAAKTLNEVTPDDPDYPKLTATYRQLSETIIRFKTDALLLAEMFTQIPATTEKLRDAKVLFEKGEFEKVNELLSLNGLTSDQNELIALNTYYRKLKENLKRTDHS